MEIEVDRAAPEPVYEQIARQVRAAIAAGRLAPGDALPSVRTLAADLGVNLNTVARAYRQLEQERFLEIEDRAGARVAPPAARPDPEARAALTAEFDALVARMRQAGFDRATLRTALERALGRE